MYKLSYINQISHVVLLRVLLIVLEFVLFFAIYVLNELH
jgi:hypothetical protein